MRTIGITGGIGAGKSLVLSYIKEHYRAVVYEADSIAHLIKEPGQNCYEPLLKLLGRDVLNEDGWIDKAKMAEKIFEDAVLLQKVNAIIHPGVKEFVLKKIKEEEQKQETDFFILEAALLIEEGYDKILDELWYVRVEEEIRKKRLQESRGYTEEKIDRIMKSQLQDEVFIKYCSMVIDNNGDLAQTYMQIDRKLGEYISAESR